jgi:hypothetical protein
VNLLSNYTRALLVSVVSVASFGPLVAHAAILGQDKDGDVLIINTSNATATLFMDLADVGATLGGTEPNNSPNALGYNGSAFRTNFSNTSPATVDLFRNDTKLLTLSTGAGTIPPGEPTFSVAAGDVRGDTYYFIDRGWGYSKVTGINGAPGTQTKTDIADFDAGGGGATTGDMAITPDGLSFFFSTGTSTLNKYRLSDGLLETSFTGAVTRYAGLTFDGGVLYGVIGGNPAGTGAALLSQLYRLDITGATTITRTKIGDITMNGSNVFLTDAAPIPEPGTYAMLLAGLGVVGLVARRRRAA